MRILVTGGAGFIGSHLVDALLDRRHNVAVVDNFDTSYSPVVKHSNLVEARKRGLSRIFAVNICDNSAVSALFREFKPEAVIHLAAKPGVRASLLRAAVYERVNVRGTLSILEAARRFGAVKMILASSSSVYGDLTERPFSESDELRPKSPYAATKVAAEALCSAYAHMYPMDIICLRLFSVFGPRQRPDLVMTRLARAIVTGKTFLVFGDGSACRDYTSIRDVVAGFTLALDLPMRFVILNIGSGTSVDLLTLIRTFEGAFQRNARIRYQEANPLDALRTQANISRAHSLMQYLPSVTFDKGVKDFASWYMQSMAGSAL